MQAVDVAAKSAVPRAVTDQPEVMAPQTLGPQGTSEASLSSWKPNEANREYRELAHALGHARRRAPY